jgi:Concanavalin A-like lectin/glucanases superfamily
MRYICAGILVALAFAAPASAGSSSFGDSFPLVAYWPMIEQHGQIVHDFSGHRNNGVLGTSTATEPSDPTWIRGGLLGALHFGGGQMVTVPDSASLEPAQVTVMSLVRASASPGTWRYVMSKGALGCRTGSYGLYTGFGGGMAFYVYDGTDFYVSPEAPTSIWDGRWHVVAGTYDGTTVRLFVDGSEVGAGTTVPLPGTIAYGLPTGGGAIGAYDGSCDLSFVGDIDEVSVWSHALPVSQIFPRAQALLSSWLR